MQKIFFFLSPDKSLTLTQHVNADNGPPLIYVYFFLFCFSFPVAGLLQVFSDDLSSALTSDVQYFKGKLSLAPNNKHLHKH